MASKVIIIIASLILIKESAGQSYSWTEWISDENPDGDNCMMDLAVAAARCAGDNCDNIELGCLALPANTSLAYDSEEFVPYWTEYISDGGNLRSIVCDWNTNGFITGMMMGLKASGKRATNIAIHCVYLGAGHQESCYWSDWFSEEVGEQDFPIGYYASGVQCRDEYCDLMSYRICKVVE